MSLLAVPQLPQCVAMYYHLFTALRLFVSYRTPPAQECHDVQMAVLHVRRKGPFRQRLPPRFLPVWAATSRSGLWVESYMLRA
jgi:hypothetical protein